MRNILSYPAQTKFTGQEIIDWCKFQMDSNGSHVKEARRLYSHYHIVPEAIYRLEYVKTWHTGASESVYDLRGIVKVPDAEISAGKDEDI